jgi:hypothetical protein
VPDRRRSHKQERKIFKRKRERKKKGKKKRRFTPEKKIRRRSRRSSGIPFWKLWIALHEHVYCKLKSRPMKITFHSFFLLPPPFFFTHDFDYRVERNVIFLS